VIFKEYELQKSITVYEDKLNHWRPGCVVKTRFVHGTLKHSIRLEYAVRLVRVDGNAEGQGSAMDSWQRTEQSDFT
jgi:hypothetical protein